MHYRQTGLRKTAGAVRKPAGAGQHSTVFNQDQKAALVNGVMQLHINNRRNTPQVAGGESREHIKNLLQVELRNSGINQKNKVVTHVILVILC